jgi:hypothetical protein
VPQDVQPHCRRLQSFRFLPHQLRQFSRITISPAETSVAVHTRAEKETHLRSTSTMGWRQLMAGLKKAPSGPPPPPPDPPPPPPPFGNTCGVERPLPCVRNCQPLHVYA